MADRIVLNSISYHGHGAIENIVPELTARGYKKAFVCSDPDLVKFGVTKKVTDLLEAAGFAYALYSEIKPNPTIKNVQDGVAAFQAAEADCIVTIGGGSKYFRQTAQGGDYAGKTLWDQAKERGYQTVENDVDAFSGLQYKDGQPVLALLSDGNMPTQYNPSVATKQDPAKDENPVECSVNEKWLGNKNASGNSASLADMTSKALDLLQANPKSQNGFFLQVEGASIDKQDHNGNACGQIGETDDLDKAISAALEKIDLSVVFEYQHVFEHVGRLPEFKRMYIERREVRLRAWSER